MLSVKLFKINLPETYKSSNEEKTSKQTVGNGKSIAYFCVLIKLLIKLEINQS